MTYPAVIDEFDTLELICQGRSIARYGDGEFNLVRGGNCVSQRLTPGIRPELERILRWKNPSLLVAIPRLDRRSPKNVNWAKLAPHYEPHLNHGKDYYSAFVTRPDSAPWIGTKEYFDKIETLWAGKDITMVYGSARSLSHDFPPMRSARSITVVHAEYAHAYDDINALMDGVRDAGNHTVLLMCGPTATCMAARLDEESFHAIDLGHIGMFWRPYANPKLVPLLRIVQ